MYDNQSLAHTKWNCKYHLVFALKFRRKEIYGEQNIKCDFEEDYVKMPERIKNSRNALDHGNVEYKFERNMYWDAELLRAMVYMLILKTAGVSDKNKLFNTLKKLSKYPI